MKRIVDYLKQVDFEYVFFMSIAAYFSYLIFHGVYKICAGVYHLLDKLIDKL